MPVKAPILKPTEFGMWLPFTVTPIAPIFVANGNGVTLVTGAQAAGSRPIHGQQWPRGSHVVLSQYATQYAGVGQRV